MYFFGSNAPENSEFKSVDTSSLQDVTYSGIFKILINSTFWRKVESQNGGSWDSLKLNCIALDSKNEPIGKLNLDISLTSLKAHQLAYFLNFKNEKNEFYLPSPEHHEGVSSLGKNYCFDSMDFLHGKILHALVAYKGLKNNGYHQYNCIGFCDSKGFSPKDISTNASQRCAEYQQFIDKLQVKKSQPPTMQYGQQTSNSYQYSQQQIPSVPRATASRAPDDVLPF